MIRILVLLCLAIGAYAQQATADLLGATGTTTTVTGATFTFQAQAPYTVSTGVSYGAFQGIVTTTSGNASGTLVIQVSNDPLALSSPATAAWMTYATLTLAAAASPNTAGITLNAPWRYVRAQCTAIAGTGAIAFVKMGTN